MPTRTSIPFSPPDLGDEEIAAVTEVLGSGWPGTGAVAARFEREFAEYLGVTSALATSSCTAAIEICLAAAGVQQGDSVITSPLTFASTVHAIEHAGATPIFADVEPDSLCVSSRTIEAAISRSGVNPKVFLPVHLHGHPCAVDAIYSLARKYSCKVIEDAAHAFPATWDGKAIGWQPEDVGGGVCFSFYVTKNLNTIDGGMITGTADLIAEARLYGLHGIDRDAWRREDAEQSWRYDVVRRGFKANMTDVTAAIGLVQLRQMTSSQRKRQQLTDWYSELLADVAEIELPQIIHGEHARHLYVIRLRPECFAAPIDRVRNRFIAAMKERGVACSVHFIPVPAFTYYRERYGFHLEHYPVAVREAERIVSLPLYTRLEEEDVREVASAVKGSVAALRR